MELGLARFFDYQKIFGMMRKTSFRNLTIVCDTEWEWRDPLEVAIEVINEGCNEMNVVSSDLPSGELLGLHGDLSGIQGI